MADIRYNEPQRYAELSLLNPAGWLPRLFNPTLTWFSGMFSSYANRDEPGPQINSPGGPWDSSGQETQAMQISAVWACLRLITESIGVLSITINERTATGYKERRDHPLWYVLNIAPNDRMTCVDLLESWGLGLASDGNCYSRVMRNGAGDVISLRPLAPPQMELDEAETGRLEYRYTRGGEQTRYTPEQIFHVRLFGESLKGLSPVGYARRSIANAWALQGNALQFNAKGGKPSGALMVDHVLKPEQREAVRKNFAELEQGGSAASRLFVLEAGMKYQQLTISPTDAQMIEQLKFSVDDIARVFRVPGFLINSMEKSTSWGTGLEQQNRAFLIHTLLPYLHRIEAALDRWLLAPSERGKLFCRFDVEAYLRGDSAGRASYYSTMVQNGLMTRNEVRTRENLDRMEGADDLTVQVNLTPIQDLGKAQQQPQLPTPQQPPPTEPDKAAQEVAAFVQQLTQRNPQPR
ncbi:phage portal protein [Cupriavidus taiwanensis]|uniref:phage portal protein n=1 Tax=Cupriavidus taiwanensis TaxID=164546 RepID=UPI000E13E565|nr:phage portal protein [Cupriavidus taiwanensis]SPA17249.1 Phage portal protein, HK97 family [Cupriavidus taiwanensis]